MRKRTLARTKQANSSPLENVGLGSLSSEPWRGAFVVWTQDGLFTGANMGSTSEHCTCIWITDQFYLVCRLCNNNSSNTSLLARKRLLLLYCLVLLICVWKCSRALHIEAYFYAPHAVASSSPHRLCIGMRCVSRKIHFNAQQPSPARCRICCSYWARSCKICIWW